MVNLKKIYEDAVVAAEEIVEDQAAEKATVQNGWVTSGGKKFYYKNGKKLTRTQRELLQANGLNPAEYRRVKDLPRLLQVVHRKTGKYEIIVK